jgi:hypothetical protein
MENGRRMMVPMIVAGMLAAMFCQAGTAAEQEGLNISQAHSWLPRITAYVDLLDSNGEPVTNLKANQFSASVQERPIKVVQVQPFEESGEGVAYIFLVDVSKSISDSQFEEMRKAINAWIEGMSPLDRMAIYSFGEEYKPVIDFTADQQDLKNALATLRPTDRRTLIHLALERALELSKRSDKGLPARRAIVVLTDGKDEGSGLTAEDVIRRSIPSGTQPAIPIYAIGYSRLPAKEKQIYLDELHRFAVVSGGLFQEAEARPLAETYGQMNRAIRRVSVLHMECDGCRPDLQSHALQISVNLGGMIQNSTVGVIFLGPPPPSWWSKWGMFVIGGSILLVIVVGVLAIARREQSKPVLTVDSPSPWLSGTTGPVETQPTPKLKVKLDVVKGRDAGSVHEIGLYERASIGRNKDCELVIADGDISSRQCELILEDGRVFLRDAGSTNGTMLNGVRISARERLETGDTIGLGHTELRITIGQVQ